MEYRVLARKWRPQVFDDVLGQGHVIRTLKNAIAQERIAHAFLFSGPRGVGKTSIARILAKALNCDRGPTPTPCNQCTHCLEITDGIAIDVREIDGASNNGVEEIRVLRENVKFAPAACRYKIYIIDEVHMLSNAAFNALLKTLEEPPAHVIFIFATTETQKVPATILSRCQCFDFRRIPIKLIADNLRRIAAADGIRISDTALAWIAEVGDGSLRDSQSVFDQVISYAGFDIADQAVEEVLGRSDRRFLFLLSAAVLAGDAAQCLRIIDEAYYAGIDMLFFYQVLIGHFRNLLLAAVTNAQETLVDLPAEEVEKLKQQSKGSSRETLQRYLEILMSEEEAVRRSPNPRLNLEAIFCRLAWLEPLIPIESILSRMEDLERRLEGGETPPAGTAGSGPEEPLVPEPRSPGDGAVGEGAGRRPVETTGARRNRRAESAGMGHEPGAHGTEQPKRRFSSGRDGLPPAEASAERTGRLTGNAAAAARGGWGEFKEYVTRQQAALGAKLESAQCLSCEEGVLRIGFAEGYLFRDDVEAEKTVLENLARQFFRQETALQIATLASGGAEAAQKAGNGNGNGAAGRAAKNHELRELRREALSNPLVLKILDLFPRAEVREVKVREIPAAGESASAPAPAGEDQTAAEGEYAGLPEEMPSEEGG